MDIHQGSRRFDPTRHPACTQPRGWIRTSLVAGLSALAVLLCASARAEDAERDSAVIAAAAAKLLCTGIFVSGLPVAQISRQELAGFPPMSKSIDSEKRRVDVAMNGLRRTAYHRDGFGCVLEVDPGPAFSREVSPKAAAQIPENDPTHPAPLQKSLRPDVIDATNVSWVETDPNRPERTRAVLVIRDNRIIAERYAPGIGVDTPLPGYSMTKGVANLLTGLLTQRVWLSLGNKDLRPEWRAAAYDPRQDIDVEDLLRMTTGLDWNESYSASASDVMVMLTSEKSPGAFAAAKSLITGGGAQRPRVASRQAWRYSSGDYAILSELIGHTLSLQGQDSLAFPHEQLFRPLGMTSAVLEPTPDGHYFLSSFMLATARDWGRLGMFLLDEYRAEARPDRMGKGLLPRNWLCASLRPSVPQVGYGSAVMSAGFWTGALGRNVPPDAFYLAGYQGQFLVIVPSLNTVVVRLGVASTEGVSSVRALMAQLMAVLRVEPNRKNALPTSACQ